MRNERYHRPRGYRAYASEAPYGEHEADYEGETFGEYEDEGEGEFGEYEYESPYGEFEADYREAEADFENYEAEGPVAKPKPGKVRTVPDCPPKSEPVDCPKPNTEPTAILDYFDFDKWDLKPGCHELMIEEIVRRIVQSQTSSQPIRSVLIAGHTDKVGDDNYNFELGRKRATTVLKRLCQRLHEEKPGLPKSIKFQITTCGERQLKATDELSRRVEVFLPSPPRPKGCPPFKERIRLHLKVLFKPTRFSIPQMLASMRRVYEPNGFLIEVVSCEALKLPSLEDVDLFCPDAPKAMCCPFPCATNRLNAEHIMLFANRNNVKDNEVAAYFVRSTHPGLNGCCAHPVGQPGVIVTATASQWSLGHELAHVLGLSHLATEPCTTKGFVPTRLMTACGTDRLRTVPALIPAEVATMLGSALTLPC